MHFYKFMHFIHKIPPFFSLHSLLQWCHYVGKQIFNNSETVPNAFPILPLGPLAAALRWLGHLKLLSGQHLL